MGRMMEQNDGKFKGKPSFQALILKKNSSLKKIVKSKNVRLLSWYLKNTFQGLRPSNTFFNYQVETFKLFDFAASSRIQIFLKVPLQGKILERSFFIEFCYMPV